MVEEKEKEIIGNLHTLAYLLSNGVFPSKKYVLLRIDPSQTR